MSAQLKACSRDGPDSKRGKELERGGVNCRCLSSTVRVDMPGTDPELRKTGIRFLSHVPWGAHLCIFYETKEDLLDMLASYFQAGLDANEFCMWAVSDPIGVADVIDHLRRAIPMFDARLSAGQIEILSGYEWYLKGDQFDLTRVIRGWSEKMRGALAHGYEGIRVSGNAFWLGTDHWKEFFEYEQVLNQSLADQKIILACTYSLQASRAADILDVARAHQCSVARRNGNWEFLETPEMKQARQEIKKLNAALDILSEQNTGQVPLTRRERVVLAQIVRGASSKEAARTLGITERTINFHRSNILQKFAARNTADLVRRVLGAE